MSAVLTEQQLDTIGQIVDTCDNGLAALKLPLRAEIHVKGLTGIVEKVRSVAHDLYVELGGDAFVDEGEQP